MKWPSNRSWDQIIMSVYIFGITLAGILLTVEGIQLLSNLIGTLK